MNQDVVVKCSECERLIEVDVEYIKEKHLCADCDRVTYPMKATEDVVLIEVKPTKEHE